MLANMVASLFEHKKIHTTEAKAKELRPFAEQLITKAKTALAREKQHLLPDGQTIDIHNRRLVYRTIRNKGVIQELFDSIAPVVETRNGGYCRITKTGTRRGDGGRTAIIELVDYSAPQDGSIRLKRKKRPASAKPAAPKAEKPVSAKPAVKETPAPVTEEVVEVAAVVEETPIVAEEAPAVEVVEAVAEETPAKEEPVAE